MPSPNTTSEISPISHFSNGIIFEEMTMGLLRVSQEEKKLGNLKKKHVIMIHTMNSRKLRRSILHVVDKWAPVFTPLHNAFVTQVVVPTLSIHIHRIKFIYVFVNVTTTTAPTQRKRIQKWQYSLFARINFGTEGIEICIEWQCTLTLFPSKKAKWRDPLTLSFPSRVGGGFFLTQTHIAGNQKRKVTYNAAAAAAATFKRVPPYA